MAQRGLPREKVLATVVHLLETTLIRVGNDDYASRTSSYGLTTLRDRHVEVDGGELRFQFKGKSGKTWRLQGAATGASPDRQGLPGPARASTCSSISTRTASAQPITSADVNDYLREITGEDITAKDFRTWAGTVLAAMALHGVRGIRQRRPRRRRNVQRGDRDASRRGSATRRRSAASATSTRRS